MKARSVVKLVFSGAIALMIAADLWFEKCLTPPRITKDIIGVVRQAEIEYMGEYRKDTRSFQGENEGLEALRSAPARTSNWRGPYYPRENPKYPWGRPYIYRIRHAATDVPEIGTFGANGKPGGKDLDEDMFENVVR